MSLFRQSKGYRIYIPYIYIVWGVTLLFVVSCSSSDGSQRIGRVTPLPPESAPVAYGASLSEWEEATQGDVNQPASNTDDVSMVASSEDVSTDDGGTNEESLAATIGEPFPFDNVIYRQIMWDGLIPADFTAGAITAKYADQLAEIEDGSPEAADLYMKMQQEFNNAPVNEVLDEIPVRLPGFIAPLEYEDDLITEFLLVPYFGACIHVPPPPANQTVLVKTANGQGIQAEDSYNPIWVMGKLTTKGTTTELAAAGYYIQGAIIEPYVNP